LLSIPNKMASLFLKASALCAVVVAEGDEGSRWDWNSMTESRTYNGADASTFQHFDVNYMMGLVGENGHDAPVLHQSRQIPKLGLSSMEKVVALTSRSTRASIRKTLVDLLKRQVGIESMYSTKKEKLYIAASNIYDFIAKLLHSACSIALSNDGLWKEQMQCFSAYRQLLEVYSMWNAVRDVAFALEHGMSVTPESLAVCGPGAFQEENFVGQDVASQRLQSQYLVSATLRACYDNLQVRIEALRRWLSSLMISMDTSQDRSVSCLFRTITVLTCLSSGNQENVLDLAIKEEHKQHVMFSFARYSSVAMRDAAGNSGAPEDEDKGASASFVQVNDALGAPESPENLREVRRV